MRKLLTWLLVTLGVAALVRRLRRREEQAALAPAQPEGEDPADELRRKLAETRTGDPAPAPSAAEASVEERRAEVHEQGRSMLDEMQSSEED